MTTITSTATAPAMSNASRLAPLSGIAFVVLVLAHAMIALDGLPAIGAPADDIVRYVSEKQAEIQLGAYLQGLAMIAFLWFHASLFGRMRAAEHGPARLSLVAVTGATGTVALLGIHISLMTVLALRGDQLGPDVVTFGWVLSFLILGMSSFTVATTMLAAGILILRTRPLPGWLGIGALVDAALWLVGGAGAASTAESWGTVGMVAFLLWLVWIAATSAVLVLRALSSSRDVPTRDEGPR